jgi:hypothetical protein
MMDELEILKVRVERLEEKISDINILVSKLIKERIEE